MKKQETLDAHLILQDDKRTNVSISVEIYLDNF